MASRAASEIGKFVANKVRKKTVKELKDGDVVKQRIRETIQTDTEKIREAQKGGLRTDLETSISNYNQGVSLVTKKSLTAVSEVDGKEGKDEDDISELLTADISETAKKRFKRAREKADDAFNNVALCLKDRIEANEFRVKAQILESADDPDEALMLCEGYLNEMHSLQQVRENFALELDKRKATHTLMVKERRKIISSVHRVNRIVFDVKAKSVAFRHTHLFIWPCIKIEGGKKEIDPLRDARLREALCKQDNYSNHEEDCLVVRSFGKENLNLPYSIATNTKGEFIVIDKCDKLCMVKVFSNINYRFLYSLKSFPIDRETEELVGIVDVDTGRDGKVYLLVEMKANEGHQNKWFEFFVCHGKEKCLRFKLKEGSTGRKLTVNSSRQDKTEVFVLEGGIEEHAQVEVYDAIEGKYLSQFGVRKLGFAKDIAAASDGHVVVLDSYGRGLGCHVREFDAGRKHLRTFGVDPDAVAITFDRASKHIVVVSAKYDEKERCYREKVSIYDNKALDKFHDKEKRRKRDP